MPKPKTAYLRIIGDVHGKHDKYVHLASQAEYSLQIGDLGFDYSYVDRNLDYHNHKVIGGNHDNYTKRDGQFIKQPAHFLKDFGLWSVPGVEPVFYVRGGYSIDREMRVEGRDWWPDEELTYSRCMEAVDCYLTLRPKLVVAHCCPESIIPICPFRRLSGYAPIINTRTDAMLEEMYRQHQPDMWIFGHYHIDWDHTHTRPETGHKTRFICLNELSYKDFPKETEDDKKIVQRVEPDSV